jgi:hypothetical protein
LVRCERPRYDREHVLCGAGLHRGTRSRVLFGSTRPPPAAPVFTQFGGGTWIRRWRPLPFRLAHSVDTLLRGRAWVNAPPNEYDWAWLIGGADHARLPATFIDSDGPPGVPEFFVRFRCTREGPEILCRNGLGDALRLRHTSARLRGCGHGLVVVANYDCRAARDVERAYRRRPGRSLSVDSAGMEVDVRCSNRAGTVVCSSTPDFLRVTFPRAAAPGASPGR